MPKSTPIKSVAQLVRAVTSHELAKNDLLPWEDSRRDTPQLGAVGVALKEAAVDEIVRRLV